MNEDNEHNKKIAKKLVSWNGFKKEGIWILFTLLILITGYTYYVEKQACQAVANNPCQICAMIQTHVGNASHPLVDKNIFVTNENETNNSVELPVSENT